VGVPEGAGEGVSGEGGAEDRGGEEVDAAVEVVRVEGDAAGGDVVRAGPPREGGEVGRAEDSGELAGAEGMPGLFLEELRGELGVAALAEVVAHEGERLVAGEAGRVPAGDDGTGDHAGADPRDGERLDAQGGEVQAGAVMDGTGSADAQDRREGRESQADGHVGEVGLVRDDAGLAGRHLDQAAVMHEVLAGGGRAVLGHGETSCAIGARPKDAQWWSGKVGRMKEGRTPDPAPRPSMNGPGS